MTMFKYQIKEPAGIDGAKSKNDAIISTHLSWQNALDELSELNKERISSFAYIKFERIAP